ncbi:hypothetical protein pEaSNUABM57_00020 [Erwinia phage pEa_SNUABM_57]|uniref:Uncharacterized protein n=1 Tax=Erwinia phage pEa_SNUABM_57 TaxID=2996118 RepID=A0A9E9C3V6_9CAUD|nr:hypothetical protein pEaSNUABM57_00020 [Erwinia phage pEa_SNUABM_57]
MNIIKSFFSNSANRIAQLTADLTLLKAKYDKLCEMNQSQAQSHANHVERLESAIARLETPIVTKALTRLSFTARLPDNTMVLSEFTLGLGRCGKVVESLELTGTDKLFIIKQWHDDSSFKNFTYDIDDIQGRVQECYEAVSVQPGTHHIDRVRQALEFERRHRMIGRRF